MTNSTLSTLLNHVLDSEELTDAQLLNLRHHTYNDGRIDIEEANLIFSVNTKIKTRPDTWIDFFVGAITDFLIRQTPPIGYIDSSNAAWLMQRIDHDGVVELESEFELLMNILHLSQSVPSRLEAYALAQVKSCVIDGTGFLACGRELKPGQIGEYEVQLLKRIIYACGGDSGLGISRREAKLLFELDEATLNSKNHESWEDLFVKANANYLMTMGSLNRPTIELARNQDKWLNSNKTLEWNLFESFKAWQKEWSGTPSAWLDKASISDAEKIDGAEAAWLIDRLNKDMVLSANERKLLNYLELESPDIHETLRPLIQAA